MPGISTPAPAINRACTSKQKRRECRNCHEGMECPAEHPAVFRVAWGSVLEIASIRIRLSRIDLCLTNYLLPLMTKLIGPLRMGHRPEIDGMRGVAVLAVIINHFNDKLLPGGYLGVDVFFVISGFVIMASLAGRPRSSFAEMFFGFYARRVRRLLPALLLFIVSIAVVICFLTPDPGITLGIGRRALFGLSNIQLYRDAVQYFSESAKLNPYTHTWSLGVEEQFYFVFPFLLLFAGFPHSSARGTRNLTFLILALSLFSLGLFVFLYPRNHAAAYFLMPSRFWEMGAGCLLFLVWARFGQGGGRSIPAIVVTISMVLLGLIFFVPIAFAVPATIAAVLVTLILLLALRERTWAYGLLTNQKLVWIGLISYSLYLWHWGVIAVSRLSIGIHWWTIPFQVLLIGALSVFSYRYIEVPFRKPKPSLGDVHSIAVGLGALILAALLLLGINKGLGSKVYLGKFRGDDFVYVQSKMPCELMSIKLDRSQWHSCLDRYSLKPHVFVLGDSHASNLVPSVQAAAERNGFAGVRYLTNAMTHPFHTKDTIAAADFWNDSEVYQRFIQNLQPKDVIVYSRRVPETKEGLDGVQNQIQQLRDDALVRGAAIVLMDDIPHTCPEEDFRRSFLLTGGRGSGLIRSYPVAST
jgi:peptidoglycan/LPS O-acetylase OafA/YrhL